MFNQVNLVQIPDTLGRNKKPCNINVMAISVLWPTRPSPYLSILLHLPTHTHTTKQTHMEKGEESCSTREKFFHAKSKSKRTSSRITFATNIVSTRQEIKVYNLICLPKKNQEDLKDSDFYFDSKFRFRQGT